MGSRGSGPTGGIGFLVGHHRPPSLVRVVSLGPPLFLSASCDWSGKFWEVSVSGLGIEPSFARNDLRGEDCTYLCARQL